MTRFDGRDADDIRPTSLTVDFTDAPDASILIETGETIVMCTASISDWLPRWRQNSVGPDEEPDGWVTGQYSMLPGATSPRGRRDAMRGKMSGRTREIQRLIGRSLRGVVDMAKLGPRSVQLDCDVLQADGGTRTASITGAWVALALACGRAVRDGLLDEMPVHACLAAISCGIVDGDALLDLPYEEDSAADVDMNVVMTDEGEFVELQGTGEEATYSRDQLDRLLDLADKGISELVQRQRAALPDKSLYNNLFAD
jgi:ribonuclease PH